MRWVAAMVMEKVVHWQEAEVVITGYRKKKSGWLIAVEENGRLRPGGVMELGIGSKGTEGILPSSPPHSNP